jgi:hypothetical protein
MWHRGVMNNHNTHGVHLYTPDFFVASPDPIRWHINDNSITGTSVELFSKSVLPFLFG